MKLNEITKVTTMGTSDYEDLSKIKLFFDIPSKLKTSGTKHAPVNNNIA